MTLPLAEAIRRQSVRDLDEHGVDCSLLRETLAAYDWRGRNNHKTHRNFALTVAYCFSHAGNDNTARYVREALVNKSRKYRLRSIKVLPR